MTDDALALREKLGRRETVVDRQPDGHVCSKCGGAIGEAKHYRVGGVGAESFHHIHCFVCRVCDADLNKDTFRERDGALYCPEDFGAKFW